MTSSVRDRRFRRIVAVFGGGADASVAGLLGSLVSEASVDVHGVFVEDQTLFRLAELPFAAEVCRVTTTRRPIRAPELERQMRVLAASAERAVRLVAERAGSPWTFRRHRGPLSTALAERADVDLLLIGAARSAMVPAGELQATALTVRSREAEASRPVVVLLDQGSAPDRALEAAVDLADRTRRELIVFVPPDAQAVAPGPMEVLANLEARRASIRSVPAADPDALLSAVRRSAPAVVVVGAEDSGFDEARVGTLQRALRCPIVVVR